MLIARIEYNNTICGNERMKKEEKFKTVIRIMTALLGIAAVYFVLYGRADHASSGSVERDKKKICVVIDAGHGCADP